MKPHILSAALIAASATAPIAAMAVSFPTTMGQPVSKYGLIQNVQHYSSNPFWTPNSPYNQRMPQPVYVQGADLNSGDCQRTVSALVASYCATRNYCTSESLDDARPALTIQLATLPNHNYVSSCAGYIDSIFESYRTQNATAAPRAKPTAFPTATAPNTTTDKSEFKIANPYAVQLPQNNGDTWAADMIARKQELQNLQTQNGAGTEHIARADFPTTAADLSFSEHNDLLASGYAPFEGGDPYNPIKVKEATKTVAASQSATPATPATPGTTPPPSPPASGDEDTPPPPPAPEHDDSTLEWITAVCGIDMNAANAEEALIGRIRDELDRMDNTRYCVDTRFLNAYNDIPSLENTCALIKNVSRAPQTQPPAFPSVDSTPEKLFDPVRESYYCCNVRDNVALRDGCTNTAQGEHIFCGAYASGTPPFGGLVRQCKTGWDDYFAQTCIPHICTTSGAAPLNAYWNAPTINWTADTTNVCWEWGGHAKTLMLYQNTSANLRAFPAYFKDAVPSAQYASLQSCTHWQSLLKQALVDLGE